MDIEEIKHTLNLDPQRESLKLVKTTKMHTWEIKTIPKGDKIVEKDIERLQELDNMMFSRFGVGIEY